ncbi:MAG: mobile mystery protein B [Proteobacteria bacterium]|nr:mobile mystery protein B [Pseudomonadota bacterium]
MGSRLVEIKYPEGATPLDPDSARGLIPRLTMQSELNEFEQTNIQLAVDWASKSRKLKQGLVSIEGIRLLHRKMFDLTWKWAGKFRQHDTNLGVSWHKIPEDLKNLCDDVLYWEAHNTYSPIEIAVRFHHKLVSVHPFPNGNGRLSRLVADLFLEYRKHSPLSWGAADSLGDDSVDRKEYLASLRDADKGKFERLLNPRNWWLRRTLWLTLKNTPKF